MDPFYFLDFDYKHHDTHEFVNESTVCFPNGNWLIQLESDEIIFQGKEYAGVEFDNESKIIKFSSLDKSRSVIYTLSINKLSKN